MPFISINDPKLPAYVKRRESSVRKNWIKIFNSVFAKEGEKMAFLVSNKWLKDTLNKSSITKRSTHVKKNEKILLAKVSGGLTKRANGTYTVDFMLTDVLPDSYGLKMSLPLLEKWAKQINSGLMRFIGDQDHEEFDNVANTGMAANEAIKIIRDRKSGFAKGVKAFIDKGKLWVRAVVNEAARSIVNKATGVSFEADLTVDEKTNTAIDGTLGGFTFSTKSNPINPRSIIKK